MSAESQPTGNTNLKKQDLSQLVMKWKNLHPYGHIAQRYTNDACEFFTFHDQQISKLCVPELPIENLTAKRTMPTLICSFIVATKN